MGLVKNEWIEAEERGWSASDDAYVCDDCVEDSYLKQVIQYNAAHDTCSYCGRSADTDIAAPLEAIMGPIAYAVFSRFSEPASAGVPWDEGAPAIEPRDTADVLLSLPLNCQDDLLQDVADSFFNDAWVRAANGHWLSSHDHEILSDSWGGFVHTVKHVTRFHFHTAPTSTYAGPEEYAPGHMLPAIGKLAQSTGLVKLVPQGTQLYRARVRNSENDWQPSATTMGAPPSEKARAGRMNPAGISYLYTALDSSTAIAETVASPPIDVVIALFETTQPFAVLNLTSLGACPSIYDETQRDSLEGLLFLEQFVREISQPVRKDGSEHIDYVPSQVVCEYFAQVFMPSRSDSHLAGIMYPSAVRPRGKNLVLFPTARTGVRKFETVAYRSAEGKVIADWAALMQALSV